MQALTCPAAAVWGQEASTRTRPSRRAGICRAVEKTSIAGHRTEEEDAPHWTGAAARALALAAVCVQCVLSPASGAEAILSSPNTAAFPRSADVALRRALPAAHAPTRQAQDRLEDVMYLLRIPQRKPYGSMEADVASVQFTLRTEGPDMLAAAPDAARPDAAAALSDLGSAVDRLSGAVKQQEPELIARWGSVALAAIARLEVTQAPGLAYVLPARYDSLPRLTGRATLELELRRKPLSGDAAAGGGGVGGASLAPGRGFVVAAGGGVQPLGRLVIELDGYSAPLSAGHFAAQVQAGKLDGIPLSQLGTSIAGATKPGAAAALPLEVFARGEFEPRYRTPLEITAGELPVLPLSVYGAVALAHGDKSPVTSSATDWFIYEFEAKRSGGLGGLSFEEGEYSVVGYVTSGLEVLPQVRAGDVIARARIVVGADRLVVPLGAAAQLMSTDNLFLLGIDGR